MVRRTLKPSLLAASRCNWLVMNGGRGLRCCSRDCTETTVQSAFSSAARHRVHRLLVGQGAGDELILAVLVLAVGHARRLAVDADEPRLEFLSLCALGMENGVQRPVFDRLKAADLALAFDNQPQRPRSARGRPRGRGAPCPIAAAKSGSPPAGRARGGSAARRRDSDRCRGRA